MLQIVHIPHPALSRPSKNIKKIDTKIHKLIKDMEKTLLAQVDPPGVGLAAPQVGVNLNLFLMKPTERARITAYINPKILEIDSTYSPKKKKDDGDSLEGCLSIPKIWSPVVRTQRVLLEYTKPDGSVLTDWFEGFEAVIVQHEVDHLNGILFTKRAVEQKAPLFEEKNGELKEIDF
jgi:peptide deformylase